jgi:UDP-N-acetylmuramate--alanine ligase
MQELKNKTIFFSGIGGIGMSGLAKILLGRGYSIMGSDIVKSKATDELEYLGAEIFLTQEPQNLSGADVYVYSAAIQKTNPEFVGAQKMGLTMLRRSELLGMMMTEKRGIAVAGTHGKTTTSTMLGMVLEEAGLDPAMAIGGEVKNIGGNSKDGAGDLFVAEACEYDRSFLDLNPWAAIVTNIEEDHLDTYGDLDHILESFGQFLGQTSPEGFICVAAEDENIKKVSKEYQGRVIDYGLLDGQFRAVDIVVCDHQTHFFVTEDGKKRGEISLIVPGAHNILNSLAVVATALQLGVKFKQIQKSLAKFTGAKRRFEMKGQKDGVLVIDDYAHHPTEVQATLDGLKAYYPESRAWCVFQPHQYSRTKFLLNDFANSFANVDKVIIPAIYAARDTEKDKKSVSSEILVDKINKISHNAICINEFDDVVAYLKQNAQKGDVVITVGAGPVFKVGEAFLDD